MNKKLIGSVVTAIVAVLLFTIGGCMVGTANRPQYRTICEFTSTLISFKLTVYVKAVRGKFDIEECQGVIKALRKDGTELPVQLPFTLKNGASSAKMELSPYYSGKEMFDLEADLTSIVRQTDQGKQITGIVFLVLGGISATTALILLFLGLHARPKGDRGSSVN